MRHIIKVMMLTTLLVVGIPVARTAAQSPAQEQAARLRLQLSDVQAKQTELQMRLQQLEEDLKPENIERSLAGVGSTRPEDLREQRQRQLEIERTSVRAQLDQLAVSRTRLETAIARADAEAYHQSAGIYTSGAQQQASAESRANNGSTSAQRPRRTIRDKKRHHKPQRTNY